MTLLHVYDTIRVSRKLLNILIQFSNKYNIAAANRLEKCEHKVHNK